MFLGVNVVFSAHQNHLVQLMKPSSAQNRIVNSVLQKKPTLIQFIWRQRLQQEEPFIIQVSSSSQLTAGFPGRVTGVDTQTAITTNGYDYYSQRPGGDCNHSIVR